MTTETEDSKARIMAMLDDRSAVKWRREAGRPEISEAHVPLGWVPVAWMDALRELIAEGRVSLRDLPPRIPTRRVPASFIVKEV